MWDFISDRLGQIAFSSWQHFSLVVQCVVLATVISVGVTTTGKILCRRWP